MIKRLFDVLASSAGLVLFAPLLAVVALAIRISDPGPVLFRQERVGRYGRCFWIMKFRTMRSSAPGGPLITAAGDPRVTPIGRLLRRTKLDELPQLVNVLRGEMSLVGPRPEVPKYVALYTPDQKAVLELRPGITDLASIRFRNEEAVLSRFDDPEGAYVKRLMPRKIKLNLYYARRATPCSDVLVVLRTIRALQSRSSRTGVMSDP